MKRQQFKGLVKECLLEIISEGGLELQPKTYEVKLAKSGNKVFTSKLHKKPETKNVNETRSATKPMTFTGDPYLDSIIRTAEDKEMTNAYGPISEQTLGDQQSHDSNIYKMNHVDYSKFADIFDDDTKFQKGKTNANKKKA